MLACRPGVVVLLVGVRAESHGRFGRTLRLTYNRGVDRLQMRDDIAAVGLRTH